MKKTITTLFVYLTAFFLTSPAFSNPHDLVDYIVEVKKWNKTPSFDLNSGVNIASIKGKIPISDPLNRLLIGSRISPRIIKFIKWNYMAPDNALINVNVSHNESTKQALKRMCLDANLKCIIHTNYISIFSRDREAFTEAHYSDSKYSILLSPKADKNQFKNVLKEITGKDFFIDISEKKYNCFKHNILAQYVVPDKITNLLKNGMNNCEIALTKNNKNYALVDKHKPVEYPNNGHTENSSYAQVVENSFRKQMKSQTINKKKADTKEKKKQKYDSYEKCIKDQRYRYNSCSHAWKGMNSAYAIKQLEICYSMYVKRLAACEEWWEF